ncbi:LAGLIDADG family homing endonuclease [Patescibacteria group bacterium]
MTKAYLLGVLHDATERNTTIRIVQKSKDYIEFLAKKIRSLGRNAWIYREGKDRNLWVVEFSKSFLKGYKIRSKQEKIDYIRGYFDTDGGVARSPRVRYYLYFAQKDLSDLQEVKNYLKELGIACGKTHNPSSRADPNYWIMASG